MIKNDLLVPAAQTSACQQMLSSDVDCWLACVQMHAWEAQGWTSGVHNLQRNGASGSSGKSQAITWTHLWAAGEGVTLLNAEQLNSHHRPHEADNMQARHMIPALKVSHELYGLVQGHQSPIHLHLQDREV